MTDGPVAMGGEDRGPTPVDLLAGSLGTCIVFCVARWCQQASIPHAGFTVELDYVHDRESHCVSQMTATVHMPEDFPKERREALLKVATGCTVHGTLCTIPKIDLTIAGES